MSDPAPHTGHLLHNLVLFGRVLRGAGLDFGPDRTTDAVAALSLVEVGRKADVYHALRALVVRRREDIAVFDEVFEAFWRKPAEGVTDMDLRSMGEKRKRRRPRFESAPASPEGEDQGGDEAGVEPVLSLSFTYSENELLRQKDFAEMTGDELALVERLLRSTVWRMRDRPTRRLRPGGAGALDLRRTLRRALRSGGEAFSLERLARKTKPRPLIVLADVSGSMEPYTRALLLFAMALERGSRGVVETFVFGTRLTRITRELRDQDVDRAMRDAARVVPDWSGGTRIGEALRRFNFDWARRVSAGRAVVLLISDGWDRGDVELLRGEMARLQRGAHRVVWLNPLLASADYEPLTRGLQAALPFVDDFLPVHNVASLEALAQRLASLPKRRATRRQAVH